VTRALSPGELALAQAWGSGLKPERRLLCSEWAEERIVLTEAQSGHPGPLRFSTTPFLREPFDNLSVSSPVWKTSVKKGRQLGFTMIGASFCGYVIDHAPGPALFATASLDLARRTSKQKIATMIDATPCLSSKVSDRRSSDGSNTVLEKSFPGGSLAIVGAQSAKALRNMTARFGIADEVDGWPMDVDDEGDPLELFFGRFDTYGARKKILLMSTPLLEATSRIDRQFLLGDQRYFNIPCIHCGGYQPIRFGWLRGPEGAAFQSEEPPEAVFLLCEHCGSLIPEHAKPEFLAAGEWRPTVKAREPLHRSYSLSSWYSPLGWFSWLQGVNLFLEAKRMRDETKLKAWTNTVDANTWKEREHVVDDVRLFNRREKYAAEVPAGALVLTAGVDVQDDRLECVVWGWGLGFECWAIETRVFWGIAGAGPQEYPGALWDQLDDFLGKQWAHESGTNLYVAASGIDTGGHATQQCYEFVKDREQLEVYAMKGRGGAGIPEVSAPTKRRSGESEIPVDLFTVGTDAMKDKLFRRLGMRSSGPGFVHFPNSADFDEEFFRSLTGEKKVDRMRKGFKVSDWVKIRRNDVLDCYVYGLAAAMILSPVWEALADQLSVDANSRAPREGSPRERQVRRTSWATNWKR
jgi:phage terminase large subunit GpA-like protein